MIFEFNKYDSDIMLESYYFMDAPQFPQKEKAPGFPGAFSIINYL
jgi:hypothetical protein